MHIFMKLRNVMKTLCYEYYKNIMYSRIRLTELRLTEVSVNRGNNKVFFSGTFFCDS